MYITVDVTTHQVLHGSLYTKGAGFDPGEQTKIFNSNGSKLAPVTRPMLNCGMYIAIVTYILLHVYILSIVFRVAPQCLYGRIITAYIHYLASILMRLHDTFCNIMNTMMMYILDTVRDDILTFHMADYSERKAGKTPKWLKGRMKAIEMRLLDASATLQSLRGQILIEGGGIGHSSLDASSSAPLLQEAGDADIDEMLDEMRKMAKGMTMASRNVARMFPSIPYMLGFIFTYTKIQIFAMSSSYHLHIMLNLHVIQLGWLEGSSMSLLRH